MNVRPLSEYLELQRLSNRIMINQHLYIRFKRTDPPTHRIDCRPKINKNGITIKHNVSTGLRL